MQVILSREYSIPEGSMLLINNLDGEKKPSSIVNFRFDGNRFFDFEVKTRGYKGCVAGEVADFNGTNRYLKSLTIMTESHKKLVEYEQPKKGSHEITTGLRFYDNIKLVNTIWEAITCLD